MFPKAIERLFGKIVQSLAGVNENKLYGLDHAILNVEVPPQQMWMNMGYWKVSLYNLISPLLQHSPLKRKEIGYGLFPQGLRGFT